jgi:ELWxxDGT repeat protein
LFSDLPWQPADCGSLGDHLLYSRGYEPAPPNDYQLLSIDGGTGEIAELLWSGGYTGSLPPFLDAGELRIFTNGSAIFATDASPSGTTPLASGSGLYGSRIDLFEGEVVIAGSSLQITDEEEPSGMRSLLSWQPDGPEVETTIAVVPDRIVFAAWDAAHGIELWSSDGTAEGTGILGDFNPGSASLFDGVSFEIFHEYRDSKLVSTGKVALFAGRSPSGDSELWVTDGTPLGTHLLRDIFPGDYPSTPRQLTRFGDRVVFSAESEPEGLELWVSDGTFAGTALLKDIAPGAASSVPDDLVVRDGVLYFSAWSPNYGREAWKSDGTTAGTVRITDIAPGPKSSSPQRFARAGNRLYFSATDHVHGYELWALSDDGSIPLFLDDFESGDVDRWDEVGDS